jgi:hypothetical protein
MRVTKTTKFRKPWSMRPIRYQHKDLAMLIRNFIENIRNFRPRRIDPTLMYFPIQAEGIARKSIGVRNLRTIDR